jgi:hypothetical protein
MDVVGVVICGASLVAGVTGTWSPCGFSMIETIGPRGHTGGLRTTVAACLTFTLGALAGGVITFATLAALGSLLAASGEAAAYVAAAAIAAAAALAELRGVAIMPQVRRQLPEHWRRLMPMPLAAGLYGVLLGLGFTTFVLTFGVFALAGIVFALGDPQLGIAVGLVFGIGRALPIALTAPVADREPGIRVTQAMAERPSLYRGARIGDGVALLGAAAILIVAAPAGATKTAARPAADPGVGGKTIVFQRRDGSGAIRRGDTTMPLPGHDPAIGGGLVAVIRAGQIAILSAVDLHEVASVPAAGADAVAISKRWLAWRARSRGRDFIHARSIAQPASPGPDHSVGSAGRHSQLGHPALDGNRLVYARAGESENAILKRVLGHRHGKGVVMRSDTDGLSSPSLNGRKLLYVRETARGSRLMLTSPGGHGSGHVLLSRRHGRLWSTALGEKRAYVTLLLGNPPHPRVLSVKR